MKIYIKIKGDHRLKEVNYIKAGGMIYSSANIISRYVDSVKIVGEKKEPKFVDVRQAAKNGQRIVELARKHGIHELDLLDIVTEVESLPKILKVHKKKECKHNLKRADQPKQEFEKLPRVIKKLKGGARLINPDIVLNKINEMAVCINKLQFPLMSVRSAKVECICKQDQAQGPIKQSNIKVGEPKE